MSWPRVCVVCMGSAPVPGWSIYFIPGEECWPSRGATLEVHFAALSLRLPTNISGCLECSFCGFDLPTPPPVLGSSQRDILGRGGGWFGGVWGGLFPFLCVYVIYLIILPPHWPFPIPRICTVQAIKTLVLRSGLIILGLSLLTAGLWHQLPPAPLAALGRGPLSPRCGSGWRRHLGWGCCQGQAGEGGGHWEWKVLRSWGGLPRPSNAA